MTYLTIPVILIFMDGKIHCEDGNVISVFWPKENARPDGKCGCPTGPKGERGYIGLVRGRLYRWEDFGGHIVRFVDMYDDKLAEVRHHEKTYYVDCLDLSHASKQEVEHYLEESL